MDRQLTPSEIRGAEAVRYASAHLREVRADPDKWEVEYVDDTTGERWLMDYPQGHRQGGGSPRLRRQDPGDGKGTQGSGGA